MKEKITDLDKEVDNQILKIRNQMDTYHKIGVVALCDYMKYMAESDDDEFWEDWSAIVSSAFHSPWKFRHRPLHRQINNAIRYEATRRVIEELR